MPKTVTCHSCTDESYSCCGSTAGIELFAGIKIVEGTTEIKIYRPFDVIINGQILGIHDYKGNRAEVDYSDVTGFTSFSEFRQFVVDCKCVSGQGTSEDTGIYQSSRTMSNDHKATLGDYKLEFQEGTKKLKIEDTINGSFIELSEADFEFLTQNKGLIFSGPTTRQRFTIDNDFGIPKIEQL